MKSLGPRSLSSAITTILTIAFYLTILAGVLTTVHGISVLLSGPEQLTVEQEVYFKPQPSSYKITPVRAGAAKAGITAAQGVLEVTGVSRARVLLGLAFDLFVLALVALALVNLREVFKTLVGESPFVRDNAARIRRIGFLIIIGEVAHGLFVFATSRWLVGNFTSTGLTLGSKLEFQLVPFLAGLVLIAIGEVFRLGAAMKEEQDLTV